MSRDGGLLEWSVTRTPADYREALLHIYLRGRGPALAAVFGAVVAGYVFFTGVSDESPSVLTDALLAGVMSGVGVAVVGIGMALFTAARICAIPGSLESLACSLSEETVEFFRESGSSTTHWSVWKRVLETRNLFILYSDLGSVHVLPKRDLSADQCMRLRILLNDKLGDGAAVFVEHRA